MRVSIMQPYFLPYLGYFRLFQEADHFVYLDDVQFPRRSYVHRNRFTKADGTLDWLTLPLEKAGRETKISDLRWSNETRSFFQRAARKFPAIQNAFEMKANEFTELLLAPDKYGVCEYLIRLTESVRSLLGLQCKISRSSEILPNETSRGAERIVKLVVALKGDTYVNSPGGVALYDPIDFKRAGIRLEFLEPFQGDFSSIGERLLNNEAGLIQELQANKNRLRVAGEEA